MLAMALFLYGTILVAYGFNRGAALAVGALLVGMVVLGGLGWRDLQSAWNDPVVSAPPATAVRFMPEAAWMAVAAVAAAYFALGDYSLTSAYMTRWLAAVAVVIAVAGRRYRWAAVAAAVLIAGYGAWIAVLTARPAYAIAALIVIALSALQLARRLAFDPVQLIAVQLAVALLMRWAYYLGSGAGLDPNIYAPGTTATPFRAELPLLAMALAAIGLGFSRPLVPALRRVGMEVPRWWHVALALAISDTYHTVAGLVDYLTYRLMPDAYYAIGAILYKTDYQLPLWANLSYAVLAGVCEETLFRGVIQPRVGILVTAVLFAAIHIQYGLTPILGLVFASGLVFGLIRKHLNLTTAVIAHAATDTGGFVWAHAWQAKALWAAVFLLVLAVDVGRRWTRPAAAVKLPPHSP
jgi:membrane protease YdiL (CAAX protease family)